MDDELESTGSSHSALLSVANNEAGERVDIGQLSNLKRRGMPRPRCRCLACDKPLVARLGEKKRHHFGHKPAPEAERCWATSPEGELHLSAKRVVELVLQRACADAATITARVLCTKCREVGESSDVVQLSETNRVLIESWGDPSRAIKPDVQVVDATGAPVLFVEVRVTHANDDAKVRFVRGTGVPLLEVEGQQVLDGLRGPEFACVQHLNLATVPRCARCSEGEKERRLAEEHRQAELAAFQQRQQRREGLRDEAERLVRERWNQLPRSKVVSWSHLHVFRGGELVRVERLEVEVVWVGKEATLSLRQRGRNSAVSTWTGSAHGLQAIYAKELRTSAKQVANQIVSEAGQGASIETFSGFRTKGYEDRPPSYERVLNPSTNSWMTMYPWGDLTDYFGHQQLKALVRNNGWRTAKGQTGRTLIEARGVDDYFRTQRAPPSLRLPSVEKDWRWHGEIEAEIDRLLSEGDAAPGEPNVEGVDGSEPVDAERERNRKTWEAFLSELP